MDQHRKAADLKDFEVIGKGRHLRLVSDGGWEYVERRGSRGVVAILAVTPAAEIVLVEQHRPAVACPVIELPAGLAGDVPGQEDESLEAAARRELIEEAGYRAQEMVPLAHLVSSPGLSSETFHIFEARALSREGAGGGDESESITVHLVSLATLRTWIADREREGCLVDPRIYAALFLARVEA